MRPVDAHERREESTAFAASNIAKRNQEARELEDGFAFRFLPEPKMIRNIAEFVSFERLCCPFFDLEIAIERESDPLWLRVRGRTGVKDFIRLEFGLYSNFSF